MAQVIEILPRGKTKSRLSYSVDIMAVNDLAMEAGKVSATISLT